MAVKKDWRDWLGFAALLAVTAIAAWMRFHQLDLKPLHHDEGVNAWFVNDLIEDFKYRYNPYYYHGPSLYFLTAPALMIHGRTAEAMRVIPALFGTLAVPAFLLLKGRLGWAGVLACAVLTAVSPVELYFSRTAIHEIYNFTFNLTLVGGIYVWWRNGWRWGLYLGATSLALLFSTKETTALTVAAMVPAVIAAWLWSTGRLSFPGGAPLPARVLDAAPARWRARHAGDAEASAQLPWPPPGAPTSVVRAAERLAAARDAARHAAQEALEAWSAARAQAEAGQIAAPPPLGSTYLDLAQGRGGMFRIPVVTFTLTFLARLWRAERRPLIVAIVLFVLIWALMFSSFGTYPKGLWGFFEAFFGWGETGVAGKGHEKVWHYFMTEVLAPYYQPLLYVGLPALIIGTALRDPFSTFNLVWFALALAAYSVIPYKTPWCVMSFSGPLFLGVGVAFAAVAQWARGLSIPLVRPLAALAPALLLAWPVAKWTEESWKIQMEEYDVDGHSFIYVQNVREFMDGVDDLKGVLTATHAAGQKPSLYMVRAHNPLRWYLVDADVTMKWANEYSDGIQDKLKTTDIIVSQQSQSKKVREAIDVDNYVVRVYHERPGQKLDVFIAKPIWELYQAAVARGDVPAPHKPSAPRSFSDTRTKEMRDAGKSTG